MTAKIYGRTIPVRELDVREDLGVHCAMGPSSAQIKIFHARAQRDLGMISDRELSVIEALAGCIAGHSRTIYNPYTGEIRKAFLPDWVGKHKEEDPPQVGWRRTLVI